MRVPSDRLLLAARRAFGGTLHAKKTQGKPLGSRNGSAVPLQSFTLALFAVVTVLLAFGVTRGSSEAVVIRLYS